MCSSCDIIDFNFVIEGKKEAKGKRTEKKRLRIDSFLCRRRVGTDPISETLYEKDRQIDHFYILCDNIM